MDTVDVDMTIQMVKGIYMYRKDHTAESTIFTPWSKKIIPFPSLRCKMQAFQDDNRQETALPWNSDSSFQFSAPLRCLETQEKQPLAKLEPDGWARIGLTL